MEPQKETALAKFTDTSRLFCVTRTSKYLALALFVALPFLGGYVGYMNAPEKVVEVERVVIQEVETKNNQVADLSAETISFEDLEIGQDYIGFLLQEYIRSYDADAAQFVGQVELLGNVASVGGPGQTYGFFPTVESFRNLPLVDDDSSESFGIIYEPLSGKAPFGCMFVKTPQGDYLSKQIFDTRETIGSGVMELVPVSVVVENLKILDPKISNWCYEADLVSYELL